MSEETPVKKTEAGAKSASSLEAILATALVSLSGLLKDAGTKQVCAICSPITAFLVASLVKWGYRLYLRKRFQEEVNQDIDELRAEMADPSITPERKTAIQVEITELRKLRQQRYLKEFEFGQQ